jgi:predicted permease
MMETIWRDVRVAIRSLGRAPGFAVATILTLAVGMGAITAMYTVVEAVLLRGLPYQDADRIVRIAATTLPSAGGGAQAPFSDRGYWHFVENNRSFEAFGGYRGQILRLPLTGDDAVPVQVAAGIMTRTAFDILGVQPLRGRLPSPEEDAPDGARVALVSQDLWASRWGSDPSLVGRTVDLNGQSTEIIGIMPASFDFPDPEVDLWFPYRLNPASENFGGHHIEGLARLSAGATIESAEADARALIARFDEVGYSPAWFTGVFDGGARVWTLDEEVVGEARQPLWILFGSVIFVLLVACSNVANLLLVRAETRVGESAVRLALGSGRARIVRQVMTESLVLAVAGGVAGAFIGWMSVRLLVAAAPPSLPRLAEIGVSGTVLAFTAGVAVLAGLLFGLLPALRLGSPSSLGALREGGRGGAIGGGRHRTRSALVIVQVALALVLLVGSGLMIRTFQQLRSVDPGFDVPGALTFEARPIPSKYGSAEGIAQLFDRLRERIADLPGVTAVGGINSFPLSGAGAFLTTVIDEFPPAEGEFPPAFNVRRVTPGYFEAMGIPIVEGREFIDDDNRLRLGSLVISDNVKRQYWPETSALGKRITVAGVPARVVGVAGDIHHTSLDAEPEQFMYLPMLDSVGGGVGALTMVARTAGNPLSIVTSLRQAVAELDPDMPIADVRTLETVVADSVSRTTFTMALLIIGAAIALFLGCVGIYGVISYIVVQRTTEIGVRMALGEDPQGVLRLVLSQGMILTAAGLALGLIATITVGNVLSSLLYGVSRFDPVTLAGGVVVFLAVATVATLVPAFRASRIAPAEALRPH